MLNETFRYVVSEWVISSEEEKSPHPIKQEEIEFLLGRILSFIEDDENDLDWFIKKIEQREHGKIKL